MHGPEGPPSAQDPHGDRVATFSARSLASPQALLEFKEVFTPRLRQSSRFGNAFVDANNALAERGPVGAMELLLAG